MTACSQLGDQRSSGHSLRRAHATGEIKARYQRRDGHTYIHNIYTYVHRAYTTRMPCEMLNVLQDTSSCSTLRTVYHAHAVPCAMAYGYHAIAHAWVESAP